MKKTLKNNTTGQISESIAQKIEKFLEKNGFHSISEIAEMGQISRQAAMQCLLKKYGRSIVIAQ